MCGICCQISKNGKSIKSVLTGVGLLEHRGYDSMGIAFMTDKKMELYKVSKKDKKDFDIENLKLKVLEKDRNCNVAIGHSRWATFGGITTSNAHPHFDASKKFFLVQNGNVENLSEIEKLCDKWERYSETDTEAIVNLIAKNYKKTNSLEKAAKKTLDSIEGANAFVVMHIDEPNKLVVANKGGTIIFGKNNNSIFIVSDPAAFEPFIINKKYILKDDEIATVTADGWGILEKNEVKIDDEKIFNNKSSLGKYSFFMEKEIFEQPKTLLNTLSGRLIYKQGISRLGGIENFARELRNVKTFHFVGCGTAYNSCLYAVSLFNRFGISARAWIASEFCYSHPVFNSTDAFIFISQSGETADTIEVINEIKIKGNICLGIINVPGSKIWRETDAGIGIRAGKEKGVASTKAFTAQLTTIVMLAVFLARQRKMTIDTGQRIIEELEKLPEKINLILKDALKIKKLTKKYARFKNYYFLGRYFHSITAEEGSLKLKEISYVHAEAYPLGEMKHGPLALVDSNFCSIVIIPDDSVFKKGLVNIHEIKGRNGAILAITNKGKKIPLADDVIYVPKTIDYLSPILTTIPTQLFAYYMALELKCNPDKPRNLAKTVTVS